MIKLPDVTLVAVDTVCRDLTRLALEDSMRHIEFGDVLVFSNDGHTAPYETGQTTFVPTYLSSNAEAEQFLWYGVPFHIRTSHFLIVQWDGFVINPQAWDDKFLEFDYIGAPWWYTDDLNVGNGGFSLRSAKMARYVASNSERYPFRVPEDHALCRTYGHRLQHAGGFKFADNDTALRFSFECVTGNPDPVHFGFHAMRNFPFVLNEERLAAREALFSDYVASKQADQIEWMHKNRGRIEAEGRCLGFMSQG